MSDKEQPIYCGGGKEVVFQDGGTVINLTVYPDDIPAEHIRETKSGKRVVRLKLHKRKSVGQYGETHSLKVDTWRPAGDATRQDAREGTQDAPQRPITTPRMSPPPVEDNLPF